MQSCLFQTGSIALPLTLRDKVLECAEFIVRHRSPRERRRDAAFVLARIPWKYSGLKLFET
jgi:hypothetical protein